MFSHGVLLICEPAFFPTLRHASARREPSETRWQRADVANQLRNRQSGTYYARVKVNGKQKGRSLAPGLQMNQPPHTGSHRITRPILSCLPAIFRSPPPRARAAGDAVVADSAADTAGADAVAGERGAAWVVAVADEDRAAAGRDGRDGADDIATRSARGRRDSGHGAAAVRREERQNRATSSEVAPAGRAGAAGSANLKQPYPLNRQS